jgi:hypothetical protein
LVIASASFWALVAGAVFSYMWSIILILFCIGVQLPNLSLFPEINFASKCVPESIGNSSSIGDSLYWLSSSGTYGIRKHLAGKDIYLGVYSSFQEHISLTTSEPAIGLQKGKQGIYVKCRAIIDFTLPNRFHFLNFVFSIVAIE